jgi:putative oxidoreductase
MRHVVPIGRVLFALVFIITAFGHFSAESVEHAASKGVPMANLLVPLSGVMALLGGLSIALGFQARIGAWLIVAFLLPVSFLMHAFWTVDDPQAAMMDRIQFMKNMALLGGALLVAYWGAGPISLDARRRPPISASTHEPLPAA